MLFGATRHAVDAHGALVVEGAGDLVADLDGLQAAAEGLRERALDEALEPALEPLESHETECTAGGTGSRGHGGPLSQ